MVIQNEAMTAASLGQRLQAIHVLHVLAYI
jgi:hypothetical protein